MRPATESERGQSCGSRDVVADTGLSERGTSIASQPRSPCQTPGACRTHRIQQRRWIGSSLPVARVEGVGVVARVFGSHTGSDDAIVTEIHRWLVAGGHEVFLDHDLRDGVAVGEEWERRLHERLRWADAMVRGAPAYIESTWCSAEVGAARSRGTLMSARCPSSGAYPSAAGLRAPRCSDRGRRRCPVEAGGRVASSRVWRRAGATWEPIDGRSADGSAAFRRSRRAPTVIRTCRTRRIGPGSCERDPARVVSHMEPDVAVPRCAIAWVGRSCSNPAVDGNRLIRGVAAELVRLDHRLCA